MPLQPKRKFTQQEVPSQPQQQGFQMPSQPDFMGLMQMIQQGNQALLKQDQTPVSRVSKDQHTQRGTPGLDQWHRNNPGAPAAGTYQPDGQYGAVGPDIPMGPNPAMQSAQQPQQGGPGLMEGFMGMLSQLFGGGEAPPTPMGAPAGNPQSHTPVPQDPSLDYLRNLAGAGQSAQAYQQANPQQMGPPRPMGPPAPAQGAPSQMQEPPAVLQSQEGFNSPNMGQIQGPPNLPNSRGPMGPMNSWGHFPNAQAPPTQPNIGADGFASLLGPLRAGIAAFQQGQQQDRTVPLLNLGKGFMAGQKQGAKDIYNSYR